jgi:hypothetical protein
MAGENSSWGLPEICADFCMAQQIRRIEKSRVKAAALINGYFARKKDREKTAVFAADSLLKSLIKFTPSLSRFQGSRQTCGPVKPVGKNSRMPLSLKSKADV